MSKYSGVMAGKNLAGGDLIQRNSEGLISGVCLMINEEVSLLLLLPILQKHEAWVLSKKELSAKQRTALALKWLEIAKNEGLLKTIKKED